MNLNNLKVRLAIDEAGIRYKDLAETMGMRPPILASLLSVERSEALQEELIDAVKKTKERLEDERVHGM